jgi:biotin-[acetyl-CoA-carboxylase] ligase BirA-like protein
VIYLRVLVPVLALAQGKMTLVAEKNCVEWIFLTEVDSTNTYLLDRLPKLSRPTVVVAHQQTAGRGRQSKTWHSQPGVQLMFSVYWPWRARHLPAALSVAVAKVLAEYLTSYLIEVPVKVKWPNDLQINGHKLAGILLETQIQGDQTAVVIGVGVNYASLSEELRALIAQPVVSLADYSQCLPARDALLRGLVDVILAVCEMGQSVGFEKLLHDFAQVDALFGKEIEVTQPNQKIRGIADGVDSSGALRLCVKDQVQLIYSGTVHKLSN